MPIKAKIFDDLKNKYGESSSFTYWDAKIDDISFFNNPSTNLLNCLNNDYIFVCLNPADHGQSSTIKDFSSFHSGYRYSKDSKLNFALQGTKYYGSYITDLFKGYKQTNSNIVVKEYASNIQNVCDDILKLKEEIDILGNKNIKVIAVGWRTFGYLKKYLPDYNKSMINHYSMRNSYQNYRNRILKQLP